MTRSEFLKPYLLLVIQPWGKRYSMQTPEGETQSDLYFRRFGSMSPYVWEGVCELFAEGDHWPSIDDIKLAVRQNSREDKPKQLGGPPTPDDYPPRLIYDYSRAQDVSMRDACLKLMPIWLRDNPEHAERERVEALLAAMHEQPASQRRDMPTLTEAHKYEFVTDAKAEGLSGHCPKCRQPAKVFVCWCQREACPACLAAHLPSCKKGQAVQEA